MQNNRVGNESDLMLPCPTCETPLKYSLENAFRPFCSHRCKNSDLAGWASESYTIPQANPEEHDHSDEA